MSAVWIIGINVFRQLIRNRILVVLLVFAASLAWAVTLSSRLGVEVEARLAKDFGLLAMEWVGFATVLLCHVVLLFEETELRTISMILAKPVKRWQYLLGKLTGSMLLLAVNQAVLMILLVFMARLYGYSVVEPSYFAAAGYLYLGNVLFSMICLLFSVFASTVPACATYASFAYVLGHFTSNLVEWLDTLDEAWMAAAVKVVYWLIPNFELFNLKDALHAGPQLITTGILANPVGYFVCYGGVVLIISLRLYSKKEF